MTNFQDPNRPGFGTGGGGGPAGGPDINRLHDYDDRDTGILAHHHTLGILPNQASPGDHIHDAKQSKKLTFSSGFNGQPVRIVQARIVSAAGVNIPNVFTQIPGCSINIDFKNPNGLAIVNGILDANITGVSAGGLVLAQLLRDGLTTLNSTASIQQIIIDTNTVKRETVAQSWLVEFGAAGSHNLQMQVQKPAGATASMGAGAAINHTGFTVIALDFA